MSISVRTRKALWARSGNRCAFCRCEMVWAGLTTTPAVILGEECHIVSPKLDGPRGNERFDGDFDGYENLILMCPTHHMFIDAAPEFFPSNKLRRMKQDHEEWVRITLQRDAAAFSNDQYQIESFSRLRSGKAVLDTLSGCHATQFNYPELKDQGEVELVAGFFQMLRDYCDIFNDLTTSEQIRIGFDLNERVKELEQMNLQLFGNRREVKFKFHALPKSDPPMDLEIGTVVAVEPANPSIFGDFMIAAFPKKTTFA